MDIQKKINQIRKQPEHIRIRYVWLCTAVSMALVIFIWIVSIVAVKNEDPIAAEVSVPAADVVGQLKDGTSQLKGATERTMGVVEKMPLPDKNTNGNIDTPPAAGEGFQGESRPRN